LLFALDIKNQKEIIKMQEVYVEPELKLAGEATEVIKGSLGAGVDADNLLLIPEMEFEAD
jgi:hypothetical protein